MSSEGGDTTYYAPSVHLRHPPDFTGTPDADVSDVRPSLME